MEILLSKFGGYILAGLAAIAGFFFAYLKGRKRERDKIQAESTKAILKTHEKVRENEKEVKDKSKGSAVDRLKSRFSRD